MSIERLTSIARFKRLSEELQNEVREEAITSLNDEADQLVAQMKSAAPEGPTGNLRASIRKISDPKGRESTRTRVLIAAGGPLTTVKHGDRPAYDYANAQEFGTQQNPSHPFFWPSWRLRRRRIRGRMKREITKTIKRKSA